MHRSFLLALLVLMLPAPAMAAACQGYSVGTFVAEAPYLLNRMNAVESSVESMRLVHADDPGISAVISLDEVPRRPVVRRSTFLAQVGADLDADVARLRAAGARDLERAVYPFDPIAWTITGFDPASGEKFGTLTTAVSAECNLHVDWRALDIPVLAGRTVEFLAALDAMRTFAINHVEVPEFLKESTAPTGVVAYLVGLLAPLLAAGAMFYMLNNMRLLPRPGSIPRSFALLTGFASAGGLYLFMSGADGIPGDLPIALYLLLAVSTLATLAGATFPRQHLVLVAFCISSIAGLAFGVATSLEWILPQVHGYAVAVLLVVASGLGLWSWHRVETTRIRRRSVRSV